MARWRPLSLVDDERVDEGFDYELKFDLGRWFVYHGTKLAGMIEPGVPAGRWVARTWAYRVWSLHTPGAPVNDLALVGVADCLLQAVGKIHDHIGRCDTEREAAEAVTEDDDDEVEQ